MRRWIVAKVGGKWYAAEDRVGRAKSFPTWAKAMEHVNRKSRLAPDITIKDLSGAVCDLTVTNRREYIHLKTDGVTFNLMPHEWKPLAHFLLDVANHKEREEA